MIYTCCDERRREHVRLRGIINGFDYNGIDYLEVIDADAATDAERQRELKVHFLKPLPAHALSEREVFITGGERIRGIVVLSTDISGEVLTVKVDKAGDYSTYTLRVAQQPRLSGDPSLIHLDPPLSSIDFSFKVECPTDFDCHSDRLCPPDAAEQVEIDYLAKDYDSFRQTMFDRMSVLVPQWRERNAADVGVALVELLAYAGDHLSYRQDVIATEAYIETARRRASVRRHAALVDYVMHDGCNARTWVQIDTDADDVKLAAGTALVTLVPGLPDVFESLETTRDATRLIADARAEIFETMHDVVLFRDHGEMPFYTWNDERCCLPIGATTAILDGDFRNLKKGVVLVFEEKYGPFTGVEGDADPAHRHAVRLTEVGWDSVPDFTDPDHPALRPVTEIEWHGEDALPFALCISAQFEERLEGRVSVALGNIVLADHGRTIKEEDLGVVPVPELALVTSNAGGDRCEEREPETVAPRFAPRLEERPLTQVAPNPPAGDRSISAASVFEWEMRDVLPAITLDGNSVPWTPQRDLLSSDAFAPEFVAEVDDDGRATIRFGDDEYGMRPTPGVRMLATYRVGNGTRGNIGADSLHHVVTEESSVTGARNPLPARRGTDAESMEHVRRSAPSAFRTQERAVTPEDYAEVAQRHREVQRAAATVRWTGSWRTIFLTVDRLGGRPVDTSFELALRRHLERYRLAGHDVEIDGPRYVALELDISVCVKPEYYRGDVKAALLRVFSNTTAPDGRRGFFHPDDFTFGQPVYLSKLYAAAQKVEGVRSVTIDTFQRLGNASRKAIDDGLLKIGRLEIARLDNDPNFPERGVLRLSMDGGR